MELLPMTKPESPSENTYALIIIADTPFERPVPAALTLLASIVKPVLAAVKRSEGSL